MNIMSKFTLLFSLMLIGVGNVWGETYTIGWGKATGNSGTYTNFTATSGSVPGILSFTTEKNQSTTYPAYNQNNQDLTLYYHSAGTNGGSITLTPAKGVSFTKIVMRTSTGPSVKYSVDGGTLIKLSNITSNSNYKYTTSDFNATSSVKIQNVNIKDVQLRILTIEVTYTSSDVASFNIAEACTDGSKYYATYSNSCAFVVPSDLTVSEISVADGVLAVTNYETNDIVPANTGVMVSSTTAGEKSVDLTTAVGSAKTNNNMLKASGDAGIDADNMSTASSDCLYYRLTMNGNNIGFWWKSDDGAPFALAANKAYLAVPRNTANNIKSFNFSDIVNAIKAVETEKAESKVIYNLAGQRVSKMQKGIYIVNGKKIFNK